MPATAPARVQTKRKEANRKNAALSTGPVTVEGKRRSSLNALRHGLTGHIVVLPTDDLAAYRETRRQLFEALNPVGVLETFQAQTIADTHWRLDRIRAIETNFITLETIKNPVEVTGDPTIDTAFAEAQAVATHMSQLSRFSLYEQRLTRILEKATAELARLQAERRQQDRPAQVEAPVKNGFEFSSSQAGKISAAQPAETPSPATPHLAAPRRRSDLNGLALEVGGA